MSAVAAAPSAPDRPARGALRARLTEGATLGLALAATLPALSPLLQAGVPATHDGFLHVQRLIAIDAAVRQGAPFTRWLPDLAYGYGQPLWLYYAPLAYLPAVVARLAGGGYAASFEIATGLAILGSVVAMYLCARALFGRLAAGVAGTIYATLPYQLVDVYVRGALAESWAFVWLPLATWCLLRAWIDGRARWSVGLAVALAGLILTHNVTALLFLPALVVLGGLLVVARPGQDKQLAVRPSAAILLGLGLGAWFWLPALAERQRVQIGETIEPELFASFFLREWPPFQLHPLFDYEQPVSTALGSPIYWPQLGLVQLLVTVAGAAVAWRATGSARGVLVWAGLLVAGGLALQAAPAAPLYDVIPLLAFVQFPWRLLTLVGLGTALLAGALVALASRRPAVRATLAGVVVSASVLAAVGRLEPALTPVDERFLSVETVARAELAEYGLGTTHSGEYLPVSSGQRNANRFRKTLLDDPPGPAAGDRGTSGLHIDGITWRADRVSVRLSAPAPVRLVLHQFSFPGWTIRLDGQETPTAPAGPFGLLSLDVPAGSHTVEATWDWTGLRAGAAILSLASLALLLPLGRIGRRRLPAVLAGGTLALATIYVATTVASALTISPGASESDRWQPIDDRLILVDVQHDTARLAAERLLTTRLTWLARRAPTEGYRVFLDVVSAEGQVHRAPWVYEPLSRHWQPGELAQTAIAVRLPPDFPAGPASLQLSFERPTGLEPLDLGRLNVPPARPATLAPIASESHRVGAALTVAVTPGDGERSPRAPQGRPGETVDVVLRWTALQSAPDVDRELIAVAVLHAPAGEIVSEPGRPGDWVNPLPFWQAGDAVEQRARLRLPATLAPGMYPLTLRVYGRDLARGGASESGASAARPRGRALAEVPLGDLVVTP